MTYRWRGDTPRHAAARAQADAAWEHDQRSLAQRRRFDGVAPEAPSPAAGATQPTQPTEEAAA